MVFVKELDMIAGFINIHFDIPKFVYNFGASVYCCITHINLSTQKHVRHRL